MCYNQHKNTCALQSYTKKGPKNKNIQKHQKLKGFEKNHRVRNNKRFKGLGKTWTNI